MQCKNFTIRGNEWKRRRALISAPPLIIFCINQLIPHNRFHRKRQYTNRPCFLCRTRLLFCRSIRLYCDYTVGQIIVADFVAVTVISKGKHAVARFFVFG